MLKSNIEILTTVGTELSEIICEMLNESLQVDHLGINDTSSLSNENYCFEIFQLSDVKGFNLLLFATEKGKLDIVLCLINLGFDTENQERNTNVQELALQNGHYDIIMALYKENLTFPTSINVLSGTKDFKKFFSLIEELNRMILIDNLERVKEIFNKLPKTRHFYNLANESALKVATKSRAFKSYDFFVSEKLVFAPHETCEEYYNELSLDDQRVIREIHNNYTQELPESHLNVLLSKSFLSHDAPDVKDKMKLVQRAYKTLNANSLIKIILMVVAASKKFKIIFDLKRDSVHVTDPTTSTNVQGIFYLFGRIYIGARQLLDETTSSETIAVMAHELCHFAMNLVYGNKANPYKINDLTTKEEFEKISKMCQENEGNEDVIDSVFHDYPETMHHGELIVRVVHLLALYQNQPEKLSEVQRIFVPLFEFYEKKIVPEMREALPEIVGRAEMEIQLKDKKISRFKKISIFAGLVAILGIICAIGVGLFLYAPNYKFSKLPKDEQDKIRTAKVIYKNKDVQLGDLFSERSLIFEEVDSTLISQILNGKILNLSDPHLFYLDKLIVHKWVNLEKKLQNTFLASNFTFQNESLSFRDIYEVASSSFNNLTSQQIVDVLDGKHLEIHKMISNQTKFYIERKFLNEEHQNNSKNTSLNLDLNDYGNEVEISERFELDLYPESQHALENVLNLDLYLKHFDDIIETAQQSRIFILSASAGMGKSITFNQIALKVKHKFPTYCVSYISLKEYSKFYYETESSTFLDLFEKILELNTKNSFEMEIFRKLFASGSVMLFWDGFDEISPKYSEYILNVLDTIFNRTQIIQFISTRPLYKDVLKQKFNVSAYTMISFDEKKKNEFLNKFFVSKETDVENIVKYNDKVNEVVKKSLLKGKNDFSTPLLLGMIAELVSDGSSALNSENLYEIYEQFVEKKVEIWRSKSQFAKKIIDKSLTEYRNFNMMTLFHMYALKKQMSNTKVLTIFLIKKLKIMRQKIPKSLTSDEIDRIGIVQIDNINEFNFVHTTFSEFFVAQFLIENICNTEYVDPIETEMILQIFFDLVEIYGKSQSVVIDFIDYYLDTKPASESKSFGPTISDILRTKFHKSFFSFLQYQNLKSFEFLLKFFQQDHEILIDLISLNNNENLYFASFDRAYFIKDRYSMDRGALKKLIQSFLSSDERIKLVQSKNQDGIIQSSQYIFYRDRIKFCESKCLKILKPSTSCSEFVEKCEQNAKILFNENNLHMRILRNTDFYWSVKEIIKNLDHYKLKVLYTSNLMPIILSNFNARQVNMLWNLMKKSLNEQEVKTVVFNILARAPSTSEDNAYLFFLIKINEIFKKSEILEIFKSKNMLHYAVENELYFSALWDVFVNQSSIEQQREMLKKKITGKCLINRNIQGQKCYHSPPLNIFHSSLILNLNSSKYFSNLYEKYFDTEEMQKMVLDSNDILPYVVILNHPKVFLKFIFYLSELFKENHYMLNHLLFKSVNPTNQSTFIFLDDYENKYVVHNIRSLIFLLLR